MYQKKPQHYSRSDVRMFSPRNTIVSVSEPVIQVIIPAAAPPASQPAQHPHFFNHSGIFRRLGINIITESRGGLRNPSSRFFFSRRVKTQAAFRREDC